MTAGAILRVKKLTGVNIIRVASMHNKRLIQAELGANGSINSSLSYRNECLFGLASPVEVACIAREMMTAAGLGKPRKNAVLGLEFVVSPPPGRLDDDRPFFLSAMDWIGARFGGAHNILSADVHRDQTSPHCHVLLLPLIGGKLRGSDAVGGVSKLRELLSDFYVEVCKPYGFEQHPNRLRLNGRAELASIVIREIKRRNDPCMTSALWDVVRDHIEEAPENFAEAMGLEAPEKPMKKMRTMAQIFTSKGKGTQTREVEAETRSNHIGFQAKTESKPYPVYGFATQRPLPAHTLMGHMLRHVRPSNRCESYRTALFKFIHVTKEIHA